MWNIIYSSYTNCRPYLKVDFMQRKIDFLVIQEAQTRSCKRDAKGNYLINCSGIPTLAHLEIMVDIMHLHPHPVISSIWTHSVFIQYAFSSIHNYQHPPRIASPSLPINISSSYQPMSHAYPHLTYPSMDSSWISFNRCILVTFFGTDGGRLLGTDTRSYLRFTCFEKSLRQFLYNNVYNAT